jgi:molecular chaperone GrpE
MTEDQNPLETTKNTESESIELESQISEAISDESVAAEAVSPDGESASVESIASDEEIIIPSSDGAEPFSPEELLASIASERDSLAQQLDAQNQQIESLKQRYIVLAAEFDNFRKRTQREKEDLEVQVKCKTLGELLAVVDNFERARTQLKPDNDGEMAIHKSYQSVYKSLVDSLKRLGVSPMRPEGQPFDPSYHEAMLREYTDECPEGTVIEQLVRGYLLGDQVLRHAMVKVAASKEPDVSAEESIGVDISTEGSNADN